MSHEVKALYEFGEFRFDAGKRVLWRGGEMVAIAPKATEVLSLLLEERGNLVEREQLINKVWSDSFVEEGNLNNTISVLRKVLGNEVIQTVPRRGYCFTPVVAETFEPTASEIVIEKRTVANTLIVESEQFFDEPRGKVEEAAASWTRGRIPVLAVGAVSAIVLFLSYGSWESSRSESDPNASPVLGANSSYPSFANGETVLTDFGFPVERAQSVAVQPDGKLVVGGWVGENPATADFALARYNPDGSLDRTFDGDGKLTTPLGEYVDPLYGLTIQPDGKILAVGGLSTGKYSRQFCIVRYKPDGALDASFNENGIVGIDLGTSTQATAYAAHVLPDGRILVVGSAMMVHSAGKLRMGQNDFAVVRLNADGSLDTSFGKDGMVFTDSGNGSDVAYALAVQPDGKILVGGMMANGKNQGFGIARYHADGTTDVHFGAGGKVRTDFFNEGNIIWSLDLQPDGKIVAGGWTSRDGNFAFAVARYAPDGSLDNSFNGNGKVALNIAGDDLGRKAFIEPDGRVLLVGRSGAGSESGFGFARLSSDGLLDDSFNGTGKASISARAPVEVHGAALTADGYAVSVGSAGDKKSSDFVLARVYVGSNR